MSERAFVCQLTLLNIDTYSNILIESSINTNEMYCRVNEKLIYVIDITFGINESIFSGNEQQNVYNWRYFHFRTSLGHWRMGLFCVIVRFIFKVQGYLWRLIVWNRTYTQIRSQIWRYRIPVFKLQYTVYPI